ncbi:PTS lactose/cellobiose transporter subunit IIA [Lactobacillus sp. DCY120]|uniref:PTS lactose/cellobiose transporter subunit IIA n=1 Tax=Bombilactobacillus apium TaxID=2675299 RepID=A0A850QVH8_9LACO|nr:PTS lactose/cellobiose transporter subunit IIA [Bombilactobacillus apium]NVY95794.1 PTS lactose/cellobiose transporter subunit IIA [Bombilactobacillus apium]
MQIILHAGNAKSDVCEVLAAIKAGQIWVYEMKQDKAQEEIKQAHHLYQ